MGSKAEYPFTVPVRIEPEQGTEENQDIILELVNRQSLEPLSLEEICIFSGTCSNDRLDSYLTKMDPQTTLRNFVEDLKAGTPLLENHNIFESPYGRSFDGQLIAAEDSGEANEVRGHWYLLRDLTVNGKNTNDTIRRIQSGIQKDMSVGFGGQKLYYRCSSCGRDVFDWECPHLPGLEDELGRMTFAWVVNGRLTEVSTVYKGATPGAYIDKVRAFIQQGELSEKNIMKLERTYHVRFERNEKRSFFMPKPKEGNDVNLLEQIRQALQENKLEKKAVYDLLAAEGETFRQPDDIAIRNELGDRASVEGIRHLKREAEQGRAYVSDLIDQAVKVRVKAQGDAFNEESYRNLLTRSDDIRFIKDEIEAFTKMVEMRFTPGRQTEDELKNKELMNHRTVTDYEDENIFD